MDIDYLLFLQNIRESMGGALDGFMLFMTMLAESKATFLFLGFIYWCVDKETGRFMGMNVAFSSTFSQMLKSVFHVDRPWVRSELIHPVEEAVPAASGYSFPSGHTTRASATWGAFGFWELKKRRKAIGAAAVVMILIIGFSRNYLGVHTPQDVVVALLYCVAVWFLSDKLLRLIDESVYGDILILIVFSAVSILWMMFVDSVSNSGAGMAFFVSLVLDRRLIHHEISESVVVKAILFVVGGAGFLLVIKYVSVLLAPICGTLTGTAASFVYMFYIMSVVPLVGKALRKIG
ncbi:phosphatase PAP2 family protein [Butyrivibrio sp. WCD2001]|uniref:phosphatase PAP2 family protein n=1 Tax=Butyrivibrio sp. WCD2001 TaxID=1280681 RepID=UPI0006782834|nr:phosphatase PAP2 family protein [Butyrivibrio sp. WCD2001]